ncbi:MAG: BON domain-containing protein [Bacteroidetes bacterium]|nr:BON domain-containing protein [Bacteroidota bacterium]MBS1757522.1 BON domain-containing protein [Bacteroidota bacterium]
MKVLPAMVLVTAIGFTSCKPKDADIKASIEKSLKDDPATANVSVMVNEGVATLSGEVKDDATKAASAEKAKAVKGVKDVVNNETLPAPEVAPAPVVVAADDALTSAVKDATKDFSTVTAAVADGVVTLTGTIEKSKLPKLMMALNGLHPKKIDNKLTVK